MNNDVLFDDIILDEKARRQYNIQRGMAVYKISDKVAFTLCKVTGHCSKLIEPSDEEFNLSLSGYKETVGYADCNIRQLLSHCGQNGVHWRCPKHPWSELIKTKNGYYCNICKDESRRSGIEYDIFNFDENEYLQIAQSIETGQYFKNLDICEIGKVYITQKRTRKAVGDDYDIDVSVKTDEYDSRLVQILIIDKTNSDGNHVQYIIHPDSNGVEHDPTNLDPQEIISKIDITLKNNCTIKCEYSNQEQK